MQPRRKVAVKYINLETIIHKSKVATKLMSAKCIACIHAYGVKRGLLGKVVPLTLRSERRGKIYIVSRPYMATQIMFY
jgi:hypothetical protein